METWNPTEKLTNASGKVINISISYENTCNLKNILIVSGPSNTFASRTLGFSIYVSNTTNKSEGTLCYKNHFTDINYITRHWKVKCVCIGQYVFYYNERLTGVTYPGGYSTYAYNDVCELAVLGKYLSVFCF